MVSLQHEVSDNIALFRRYWMAPCRSCSSNLVSVEFDGDLPHVHAAIRDFYHAQDLLFAYLGVHV